MTETKLLEQLEFENLKKQRKDITDSIFEDFLSHTKSELETKRYKGRFKEDIEKRLNIIYPQANYNLAEAREYNKSLEKFRVYFKKYHPQKLFETLEAPKTMEDRIASWFYCMEMKSHTRKGKRTWPEDVRYEERRNHPVKSTGGAYRH